MSAAEKRILNCPIDATSLSSCNLPAYLIRVGANTGPGIVIAILMFLSIFVFCCFRFVCNICGGRAPSPNVCCPPSRDKGIPARYGTWDIWRAKLLTFACAAVAVAALSWGNAVSSSVVAGLNGFGDAIVRTPNRITVRVDQMEADMAVVIYDASTDTSSTVNYFSNSTVKTEARGVRDKLTSAITDSLDSYRAGINQFAFVLFIIFSVPSALVILAAPLALLNIRRIVPFVLVWLIFVLGTCTWMVHGVFAGTSFVVDGVCTEVSGAANNRRNVIAPLIGCSGNIFSAFSSSFNTLRDQRGQAACTQMAVLCYDYNATAATNVANGRTLDCGSSGDLQCGARSFANVTTELVDLRHHPNVANFPGVAATGATCVSPQNNGSCTTAKCAVDCRFPGNSSLSPVGRQSLATVSLFDAASRVSSVVDSLGSQFGNCDAILAYILFDYDTPCQTLTRALSDARDCAGMLGYTCIAAIFALVGGSKRFRSLDEAGKAIDENGDEAGKQPPQVS
jgi:hypothetical protein